MHTRVCRYFFPVYFLLIFASCMLFSSETTHAQSFFEVGAQISLVATPPQPEPNSDVTISLDDYSVNAIGARITWYEDGKERVADTNKRSITVRTGALGQKKTIGVTLTRPNSTPLTASLTLAPSTVDIIIESDTYTPTFYKGRALPSTEAPMRVIALVHAFPKLSLESYTYTWKLGTEVLNGGPQRGAYAMNITMPRYDRKVLSVQVTDQAGNLVATRATELRATEPEILFYEHSALRGLSDKIIASPYPLLGDETLFYGEPYFLNSTRETSSFEWTIDGKNAQSEGGSPNAISLRKSGTNGNARIGLTVTTKELVPQQISEAFELYFK